MTTPEPTPFRETKGQLPPGWRWVPLGEVCEFTYGSSLPSHSREAGAVPVYGSNGVVGYHNQLLTKGPTIVIGRKGSIGEVHYSPVACWPIDTTYYVEKTKVAADLVWLSHWLRALNLGELNKAAAVPGLNRDDAHIIAIPFPPLAEQRRIAAFLNEEMAALERARAAAEAQLEAAKALPTAYLRAVFNSPDVQHWPTHRLGELCDFLDFRRIPVNDTERAKRIAGKKPSELFPYYGANGQVGWIDGYIFDEPLILLAEDGGNFGSTERPIAYTVSGKYWVNNHAHVLKPRPSVDFEYCLHTIRIRPDVGNLTSGSTRAKLNQEVAASIPVPVPPPSEQKRIAAILNEQMAAAEKTRKALEEKHDAINALPAALLRRAFSGEL